MSDNVKHYFGRGNTARGPHPLLPAAFGELGSICLLEGQVGGGQAKVLQLLADSLQSLGFRLECFHNPLRPEELEAVAIVELSIGFVDGSAFDASSFRDPNRIMRIDLEPAADSGERSQQGDSGAVRELEARRDAALSAAYAAYRTALHIHDEWESCYIQSMDYAKADQVAAEQIERFFGGKRASRPARVRRLYFGAATPEGAVDHIPNLTAAIGTRIFIKGRPGSGKSTMLKKIAAASERYGCDVDIFHCGLDPNSLDMLILPDLDIAIFDSTAPHQYEPERDGDEILDMYERTMTPGTDEQYAEQLAAIRKRYSDQMQIGTKALVQARELDDRIRSLYPTDADPRAAEQLIGRLQASLFGAGI